MSLHASRIAALRTAFAIACLGGGAAAQAQDLAIDCDVWDTRSRILAHATGLDEGDYRVKVISTQRHQAETPPEAAMDGTADFHFDSRKSEIADGATKISRNFITHDKITAYLIDPTGLVLRIVQQHCHDHGAAETDGDPDE